MLGGMTVREMLERIDSPELSEWMIWMRMKAVERKEAEDRLKNQLGAR